MHPEAVRAVPSHTCEGWLSAAIQKSMTSVRFISGLTMRSWIHYPHAIGFTAIACPRHAAPLGISSGGNILNCPYTLVP